MPPPLPPFPQISIVLLSTALALSTAARSDTLWHLLVADILQQAAFLQLMSLSACIPEK